MLCVAEMLKEVGFNRPQVLSSVGTESGRGSCLRLTTDRAAKMGTADNPLADLTVSVVINTYNRAASLDATLRSLRRLKLSALRK